MKEEHVLESPVVPGDHELWSSLVRVVDGSCCLMSSSHTGRLLLEKRVLAPIPNSWIISCFTGTQSAFLILQKGLTDKYCRSY